MHYTNQPFNQQPMGYGNFGQPQYNPYQQPYGQAQPQVKINNILTPEEIDSLRQKSEEFSLSLSDEDIKKSWCLHFDANGNRTLVEDPDSQAYTCSICGSKFEPVNIETGIEDLYEAIQNTLNIIQSIKCFAPNLIPVEAAKKFYTLIPLLEKVPKLFTTSVDYAIKNDPNNQNNNNYYYNQGMGTSQQFQNLAGMFAGAMAGPAYQGNFYNVQNPNPASFGYAGTATPQNANPFGQPGGVQNPQQSAYPQPNPGFQYNPDPAAANQPVQTSVQAPVPTQPAQVIETPAAPVSNVETTTVKEEVKL